jgi:hypothetical protein
MPHFLLTFFGARRHARQPAAGVVIMEAPSMHEARMAVVLRRLAPGVLQWRAQIECQIGGVDPPGTDRKDAVWRAISSRKRYPQPADLGETSMRLLTLSLLSQLPLSWPAAIRRPHNRRCPILGARAAPRGSQAIATTQAKSNASGRFQETASTAPETHGISNHLPIAPERTEDRAENLANVRSLARAAATREPDRRAVANVIVCSNGTVLCA